MSATLVPVEEESNSPPHDSKNDTRLPFSTEARAAFMPDPLRSHLGEAIMRYWNSYLREHDISSNSKLTAPAILLDILIPHRTWYVRAVRYFQCMTLTK
jgi:hypothetical protein